MEALGYDSIAKAELMFGLGSPKPALDYLLSLQQLVFLDVIYVLSSRSEIQIRL